VYHPLLPPVAGPPAVTPFRPGMRSLPAVALSSIVELAVGRPVDVRSEVLNLNGMTFCDPGGCHCWLLAGSSVLHHFSSCLPILV
jgi:hypothetical protein